MYHEIYRPEERRHLRDLTNPAYNTALSVFRKQMTWLYESNVKTLTIDDLFLKKTHPEKDAICLTFDDGWLGNYIHAYPILQEFGFKATFFVATSLIGRPLYMTWEQLKQMQASSGMSIQSHTVSHHPLGDMEDKELAFELYSSKQLIEEKLSTSVKHLSLPHGHWDSRTWPIAKKIGYQSICTSDVGFHIWDSPDPLLRRISIGDGISESRFHLLAQCKNRAIWDMAVIKSLKNVFRRTVGIDVYRKLYRRVYGIRG